MFGDCVWLILSVHPVLRSLDGGVAVWGFVAQVKPTVSRWTLFSSLHFRLWMRLVFTAWLLRDPQLCHSGPWKPFLSGLRVQVALASSACLSLWGLAVTCHFWYQAGPGSKSSSATYQLCGLRIGTSFLRFQLPHLKNGWSQTCPPRAILVQIKRGNTSVGLIN